MARPNKDELQDRAIARGAAYELEAVLGIAVQWFDLDGREVGYFMWELGTTSAPVWFSPPRPLANALLKDLRHVKLIGYTQSNAAIPESMPGFSSQRYRK